MASPPPGSSQQRLMLAAASGRRAGFSVTAGSTQPMQACTLAATPPSTYTFCDLRSLTLRLADGTGLGDDGKPDAAVARGVRSAVFELTARKRHLPVHATVYQPYKGDLGSHDLIIEALSDPPPDQYTHDLRTGKGRLTGPEDGKPLQATLTAVNRGQHPGPLVGHPHASVSDGLGESDAGRPIETTLYAASAGSLANEWLAMLPFRDERARRYTLEAVSCGVTPAAPVVGDLRFGVVVLPQEEWTVAVGLPLKGLSQGSSGEASGDLSKKPGGSRWKAEEIETKSYDSAGERTEIMERKNSRKLGYRETVMVGKRESVGLILVRTRVEVEKGRSEKGQRHTKTRSLPFAFTYKSGGVERRFSVDEDIQDDVADAWDAINDFELEAVKGKAKNLARRLSNVKTLANDIGKLFSLATVPWKVKYEFDLFQGELQFRWGVRWPATYAEQNRVYYVERFMGLGGEGSLIKGSVEGLVGLDFDKLGCQLYAKLYAKVEYDARLGAQGSVHYTNPDAKDFRNLRIDFNGELSLKFEAGVTAGASAWGNSLYAKLALVAPVKGSVTGYWTTTAAPKALVSAIGGPVRLIGEVEKPWGSIRRHQIEPIILIEKRVLCENKEML